MKSIQNLITAIEQLKEEHKKHNFDDDQLETLDEILGLLKETERRDKVKDATEISLNIATIVKLIYDLLTNSS